VIASPAGTRRRSCVVSSTVLIAALLASTPTPADAARPLPRVRVIATGGTIGNAPTGRLSASDLVAGLPRAERLGRLETETFANLPSAVLTMDDCARLSRHLAALLATDRELDGVVVTSGTDTLEELAWFLYLTLADDRPIVVVGAMRRPGAADADGPVNLADAVRVAGHRSARGLGTVVVMHGQILSARQVRKRHATNLDAFDAPESERLGTVKRGRVQMRMRSGGVSQGTEKHLPISIPGSLALPDAASLPRVDVLLTYQDAEGDLIDAAVAQGARGIVLAGAGAGALTPSQADAVRRVAGAGVPVVIGSRTGAGAATRPDTFGALPILAAGDLEPLKTRLVLVLALARGMDESQIARLFGAGSLNERQR
jgi:L-asparaginase